MKLKVTADYRFLFEEGIVKIYYLHGMPFAWDRLTLSEENEIDRFTIYEKGDTIYAEQLLRNSAYLIIEELHPLLFDIELDPESELPDVIKKEE
jgi:hypothetical protein